MSVHLRDDPHKSGRLHSEPTQGHSERKGSGTPRLSGLFLAAIVPGLFERTAYIELVRETPIQILKARGVHHVRAPRALHFPTEALVPESRRHLELRTCLFALLKFALSDRAHIGSEQFVYFDPTDPSRCLAPDAFVCLGRPDEPFDSWKTWEQGTPQLAVEIDSDSDTRSAWEQKLQRYHALGVQELVRFDPDSTAGMRIRVWDRIEGDLVERVVEQEVTPCSVLDLWWVVRPGGGWPAVLRLARDPAGQQLLPTPEEHEEQLRQAESRLREAEQGQREAAERRIAELEAELRRRGDS